MAGPIGVAVDSRWSPREESTCGSGWWLEPTSNCSVEFIYFGLDWLGKLWLLSCWKSMWTGVNLASFLSQLDMYSLAALFPIVHQLSQAAPRPPVVLRYPCMISLGKRSSSWVGCTSLTGWMRWREIVSITNDRHRIVRVLMIIPQNNASTGENSLTLTQNSCACIFQNWPFSRTTMFLFLLWSLHLN